MFQINPTRCFDFSSSSFDTLNHIRTIDGLLDDKNQEHGEDEDEEDLEDDAEGFGPDRFTRSNKSVSVLYFVLFI